MKLKTMADVCSFCKGKCCQPPIYLSKFDVDRLEKAGKKFKIKRTGEAGYDLVSSGKCPFLKVGVGCTLPDDIKPIDCTLYPLAFTVENNGFTFYLNGACPYTEKVPKKWIQETIIWANENLKHWSMKEKRTYAARQKDRLIEIK